MCVSYLWGLELGGVAVTFWLKRWRSMEILNSYSLVIILSFDTAMRELPQIEATCSRPLVNYLFADACPDFTCARRRLNSQSTPHLNTHACADPGIREAVPKIRIPVTGPVWHV